MVLLALILNIQLRNHPCDLAKRSGSQVEDVLPFVDGSWVWQLELT